jgi:hypothetical protein
VLVMVLVWVEVCLPSGRREEFMVVVVVGMCVSRRNVFVGYCFV